MDTLVDTNKIPIIDMGIQCLTAIDTSIYPIENFANKLDEALATNGIALLINHGLNSNILESASRQFVDFCHLPSDIKQLYECRKVHGYIAPDQERFNNAVTEVRHTFNYVHTIQSKTPDCEVPGFRANLLSIVNDFNRLQQIILRAFAYNLNVNEKWFCAVHKFIDESDTIGTTLRLINYPPVGVDKSNRNVKTRCGAHCDYGTFTLSVQDSEGGLEIIKLNEPNVWHRVGHKPGAICIFVGEIMEKWSQQRYQPIWHRVVIPDEEAQCAQRRNAIIWFSASNPDVPVGPLTEVYRLMNDEEEMVECIKTGEFLQQKLLNIFQDDHDKVLG